jgi:hypothetical protein
MGRRVYNVFANVWPKRFYPWVQRINAMPKFVFSSTLADADWTNATIVLGDVVGEVAKLRARSERPLLVYGHGLFTETLPRHRQRGVSREWMVSGLRLVPKNPFAHKRLDA